MRARKPGPLYRRVVWWLLGYLALLSIAVFSVGNYVHEHAEHAAWRALLVPPRAGRATSPTWSSSPPRPGPSRSPSPIPSPPEAVAGGHAG